MEIEQIKIDNFRNIKNCYISPGKKINFIYGKNAQGKTNLIESIYYSSLLKSFRTNKKIDLINEGQDRFTINLKILNYKVRNNLFISQDKNKNKKIIINNKKPDNKNFYKILNCIIYFPDEISYLKAYPAYRRNLIDRSIFFINNEYINLYKKYLKCLKQRNAYLKSLENKKDVWKEQLIEYAYLIIIERINYIKKINSYFDNIYEEYSIEYKNYKKGKIKEELINKFNKAEINEKKYGYTLVGPHLDDFSFLVNKNNMNKYSSEGQKRSLLLNYKQAQLQNYNDEHGYYPILLFDDIGSELDLSRKQNIFNKILENCGQVFITTMDKPDIQFNKSKAFKVNKGEFSEFII